MNPIIIVISSLLLVATVVTVVIMMQPKLNDADQIKLSQEGQYINLAELSVFDEKGKKVIPTKVEMSSVYREPDYIGSNLIDGNINTVAHTKTNTQKEWILITLPQKVRLSKIEIINRQGCCQDRVNGMIVQTLLEGKPVTTATVLDKNVNKITLNYNSDKGFANISIEEAWKVVDGINVPLIINENGDLGCMSTNGKDCLWQKDKASAVGLQKNFPSSKDGNQINPLWCGEKHKQFYGMTGYDNPEHWCSKGLKALGSEQLYKSKVVPKQYIKYNFGNHML